MSGDAAFCSPSIFGDVEMTLEGDEGDKPAPEVAGSCSPVAAALPLLVALLSCLRLVMVLLMHRFGGSLFSLFSDDEVANGLPVGQCDVVGVCSTANCELST